ncbi:MAG: secondary thiamine-phosphate synthase enzyme YjbQ [Croceibacterium sp.]
MHQARTILTIATPGRGLHEITEEVADWLGGTGIGAGVATLFCQHTSASLLITENASSAVQRDILRWLERAVPEGAHYEHDDEGADDMPAHIKALITGNSLTVPVIDRRLALGTWQGVFLAEHRTRPHSRRIAVHVIGE